MLFRHLLYQLSYLAVWEVAEKGGSQGMSQGDFSNFYKIPVGFPEGGQSA